MADPTRQPLPALPSDADDDEALRYAIALSLQDQQGSPAAMADSTSGQPDATVRADSAQFGSVVLDRKAMEEERLKRLAAKRPRPADGPVAEAPPPKKVAVETSATTSTPHGRYHSTPSLQFPDGTVKRTWAYGYPRTSDDIKIEEVLQADRLDLAVLSSYQWDDEWMLSKIDVIKTKLVLVAFAIDEAQKNEMQANAPPNVRFCFPPMNGPGAMHSKLQVLKYSDSLRIVVPTGNLVPYDWGETGVMENMVFMIDLPRLPNGTDHRPTSFSTELARFMRISGIDEKMVASLTKYDFSRTEKLGFVYTIPGSHTDELRRRTGYCGLGDCVAGLGLANPGPVDVDIVAASLGSIHNDLIGALYNACQGDNGMKEYNERVSRKRGQKPTNVPPHLKEHLRIYFPSDQTVAKSRGGRGAAGTICVQAKWWRSPTFPTGLVRDCENIREGLLMHSKIIFVRPAARTGANKDPKGPSWAYLGSANLSESAWGRLVKDSKTGKPKMNSRNWECGVVVPARHGSTGTNADNDLNTVFGAAVPVPMRVPGRSYGMNEEPWLYAGSR